MRQLRRPPHAPAVAPLVTVAIPNYNYGGFLGACLDSVLAQTGVEIEVIVVDDASTDGSESVVADYAARDSRVSLRRHATNKGHIETFNECYAAGTGKYLVKLDADDLLTPGQLARSTALMEAHSDVSFSYGHVVAFSGEPPQTTKSHVRSWSVWAGRHWLEVRCKRAKNVIRQPEAIIRRTAIEAVGVHREAVPAASDLNFWLRLATAGAVGRVNGPDQGCYRIHGNSMQRTIHQGLLQDLTARRDAFELFFAECSEQVADADSLAATLHRSLARDAYRLAQEAHSAADHSHDVAAFLSIASELDPLRYGTTAEHIPNVGTPLPRRVTAIRRDVQDRLRWRYEQRTGL